MKKARIFVMIACLVSVSGLCRAGEKPSVTPGFISAASREKDGSLSSRQQLTLNFAKSGILMRLQILDKRPVSGWEEFLGSFKDNSDKPGISSVGGGFYLRNNNSCLLWGMLETQGLTARIRNPWIRGVPFVDSHSVSRSDLRTGISASSATSSFLMLESAPIKTKSGSGLRFFSSVQLEHPWADALPGGFSPLFLLGADYRFSRTGQWRVESAFVSRALAERSADTWFSEIPPLPVRGTQLKALSLILNTRYFGAASDMALSETFAYGPGHYGNIAFRIGDKPWRFNAALDGADSRFVGSGGEEVKAGFRASSRIERYGKALSLFRAGYTVYSPGHEDGIKLLQYINRHHAEISYRFPLGKPVFSVRRLSLGADHNRTDPQCILDSAEMSGSLKAGPVSFSNRIKISGEENGNFGNWKFHECYFKETLGWSFKIISLGASVGCALAAEKEAAWDLSVNAALKGKLFPQKRKSPYFRLSARIESAKLPEKWSWSFSWRFEY